MDDSDSHLRGIVARDVQAFARWMAATELSLRRSLRSFAGSVDVEAVVQETLLRTWEVAPRHRPDGRPDSLLRLALTIARRLAIDIARRERRQVPYDESVEAELSQDAMPEPMPDPLLARVLRACLQELAGRPARAMRVRLGASGERDDELAAMAGMAVNTFRQNVSRARQAIGRCLAGKGVRVEEHLG